MYINNVFGPCDCLPKPGGTCLHNLLSKLSATDIIKSPCYIPVTFKIFCILLYKDNAPSTLDQVTVVER